MRLRQVVTAGRMLAGRYTAFNAPAWGRAEHDAFSRGDTGGPAATADFEALAGAVRRLVGCDRRLVAASSGRAALLALLRAWERPPSAEVVLPSFSCAGLVEGVAQAGVTPVLVDVGDDLNISAAAVEATASGDTAVVIVPHLAGVPARDLGAIVEWARSSSVRVVEDVAQAAGLSIDGRAAGTHADAALFSSGPGKPLFGPGGGWVLIDDEGVAERARGLLGPPEPAEDRTARRAAFRDRYCGGRLAQLRVNVTDARQAQQPAEDRVGAITPMPIDAVDASIAAAQLDRATAHVETTRRHAARWRELVGGAGIDVALAPAAGTAAKLWVTGGEDASRDAAARLRLALRDAGVQTEPLYVPLHRRAGYATLRRGDMPGTDRWAQAVYSVPTRPNLEPADWHRIEHGVRAAAPRTARAARTA